MNSISIIVYSYKAKHLRHVIDNVINMSSGKNNLIFKIIDQYPLLRSESFNEVKDLHYRHVFWDHITSPCKQKQDAINESKTDYLLLLSDNVLLSKNWDIDFTKNVDNTKILSGQNIKQLYYLNMFKLSYKNILTDEIKISQFIDRSFIFGEAEVMNKIGYPIYLKYNGEQEALSLMYFCNGIDIYSMPNKTYTLTTDKRIEDLYTTFSKDHNYNEMVELFKTGKNSFIDLSKMTRTALDFCNFHSLDSEYMKKIPFPDTDVLYNPHDMKFDEVDSKRFMTKVNYIS